MIARKRAIWQTYCILAWLVGLHVLGEDRNSVGGGLGFRNIREYKQLHLGSRRLLQNLDDRESAAAIEKAQGQVCLGARDFSSALLELCIVQDLSEYVSLPSTYRMACCNLVQQYFSNDCKGTCVTEAAMKQTNVWLTACRVNLPPLVICTPEELQLEGPVSEEIVPLAIQAVQEAQDVMQASSQSPQLQKDPVDTSVPQDDSLSSLSLDTSLLAQASPPPPAPFIELFSSGEAEMRAAPRQQVTDFQVQTSSTYILPSSQPQSTASQVATVMPLSIPILPSVDLEGFSQLSLLDAIQSLDAIKIFANTVIANQQLVDELQKPGFFSVFAPTDTAVVEFFSTRIASDNNLWADAIIHHFVADKINIASIEGQKPLLMFDNKETLIERISTSVAIGGDLVLLKGCCSEGNFARVVVADVPVKNGMLHVVDRVLVPYSGFP